MKRTYKKNKARETLMVKKEKWEKRRGRNDTAFFFFFLKKQNAWVASQEAFILGL